MEQRQRSADLFPTDKELPPDRLIGRAEDVSELSRQLFNGISLILAGPRRTGKTSACNAALAELREQDVYVAQADLFKLPGPGALSEQLVVSAVSNRSALHRVVLRSRSVGRDALRAAQLSVRMHAIQELGEDIEIAFTPGSANRDPARSLEFALNLLQRIAEADGRRMVLFVDEFQEIAGSDQRFGPVARVTQQMAAMLKSSPLVTCLFAGSVEHLLRDLFNDETRAFYQFGLFTSLGPIARDAWQEGLARLLADDDCTMSDDAFSLLMERCEGHPRATMLVMQQAHDAAVATGARVIDASLIGVGWHAALRTNTSLNVETVERIKELTTGAFAVSTAIAQGVSPYEVAHPQQARRALDALVRAGVIEEHRRGRQRIGEPTLREFLASLGEPPAI